MRQPHTASTSATRRTWSLTCRRWPDKRRNCEHHSCFTIGYTLYRSCEHHSCFTLGYTLYRNCEHHSCFTIGYTLYRNSEHHSCFTIGYTLYRSCEHHSCFTIGYTLYRSCEHHSCLTIGYTLYRKSIRFVCSMIFRPLSALLTRVNQYLHLLCKRLTTSSQVKFEMVYTDVAMSVGMQWQSPHSKFVGWHVRFGF